MIKSMMRGRQMIAVKDREKPAPRSQKERNEDRNDRRRLTQALKQHRAQPVTKRSRQIERSVRRDRQNKRARRIRRAAEA